MRGGIHPERDGDKPPDDQRDDREHHRKRHPLPDHVFDRHLQRHRLPPIAARDDPPDPLPILDINRLVQSVSLPHDQDLSLVDRLALGPQAGGIRTKQIAGGKLDDDEGDNGDDEQRGNQDRDPAQDVTQHGLPPIKKPAACADGDMLPRRRFAHSKAAVPLPCRKGDCRVRTGDAYASPWCWGGSSQNSVSGLRTYSSQGVSSFGREAKFLSPFFTIVSAGSSPTTPIMGSSSAQMSSICRKTSFC